MMSEDAARRWSLAGRAVLVTGATGAVGGHLVEALLEAGARVFILTRSAQRARARDWCRQVRCREGDLSVPDSLRGLLRDIEVVIHLASYKPGPHEPDLYASPGHWTVSVEGTRALLAEAASAGVTRFIYLSSIKAMGDAVGAAGVAADERSLPSPACAYGRAKLEAERALLAAGDCEGMHVAVLRSPMVYGLDAGGNLPRLVRAVADGRFPPWPRVRNRRSAIHVRDLVAAILLVLSHPRAAGQVYLVTDGQAYSTRWLYEQSRAAMGRPVPTWTVPMWLLRGAAQAGTLLQTRLGRPMPLTSASLGKLSGDAWFSSKKIEQELGFVPRCSLEGEIPRLVGQHLVRRGASRHSD